jgi:DNA-binding Lrp family transcriptional regulator
MTRAELDRIDEGILFLLQEDARNVTTKTIADEMGVASSTVANRIKKLENRDIIRSYRPDIDYGRTEYDHHLLVIGTVESSQGEDLIEDALDVRGVIGVRELLTDEQNVSLELLGATQDDVEEAIEKLREVGVAISRTEILKRELVQPFDDLGKQFTSEE